MWGESRSQEAPLSDQVIEMLTRRAEEAEEDARRLRDAIKELQSGAAPRRTRSPRRAQSKPAAKSAVPLAKLLSTIKAEPGLTTTTLAKQLEGDQTAILALLKAQEQSGTVRREGQRRATKWFPHTAAAA